MPSGRRDAVQRAGVASKDAFVCVAGRVDTSRRPLVPRIRTPPWRQARREPLAAAQRELLAAGSGQQLRDEVARFGAISVGALRRVEVDDRRVELAVLHLDDPGEPPERGLGHGGRRRLAVELLSPPGHEHQTRSRLRRGAGERLHEVQHRDPAEVACSRCARARAIIVQRGVEAPGVDHAPARGRERQSELRQQGRDVLWSGRVDHVMRGVDAVELVACRDRHDAVVVERLAQLRAQRSAIREEEPPAGAGVDRAQVHLLRAHVVPRQLEQRVRLVGSLSGIEPAQPDAAELSDYRAVLGEQRDLGFDDAVVRSRSGVDLRAGPTRDQPCTAQRAPFDRDGQVRAAPGLAVGQRGGEHLEAAVEERGVHHVPADVRTDHARCVQLG